MEDSPIACLWTGHFTDLQKNSGGGFDYEVREISKRYISKYARKALVFHSNDKVSISYSNGSNVVVKVHESNGKILLDVMDKKGNRIKRLFIEINGRRTYIYKKRKV